MGPVPREYFHVRIQVRAGDRITALDLSEGEVRRRFVEPYRAGGRIVSGGRTVAVADIEAVHVSRSEVSSKLLRPAVRQSGVGPAPNMQREDWALAEFADDVTDTYITAPAGRAGRAGSVGQNAPLSAPDRRKVFVVHGRDRRAAEAVFDFLRALDLAPLEWDVARGLTRRPSPYVGEVLDAAFSAAQAVLVLFTPDEEVSLRPQFHRHDHPEDSAVARQARPNVLFEAGMALGWDESRTVLVELGRHRPFSDIDGRLKIEMEDSIVGRQRLAHALRDAGCAVDLTGFAWHRAGDFSAALKHSNKDL